MDSDPHIVPTLLAWVVLAATVAWALLAQIRTRPRQPEPAAPTMELGPESPAVVDLLTDDFAVTAAAVPATVVDLAARRWLSIEEVTGGNVVIRLRRERDEALQAHERRVLDHLRTLAVDGVVPAAAMTTGTEAGSRQWWRAFRREVVADAQARGLCRDRWTRRLLLPIWVGTLGTGAVLWLADRLGDGDAQTSPTRWLWALALVAAGGLGFWSLSLLERGLQRDTDAGLATASRWLGVREHMATSGSFEDKPAASVALWDRQLAHAVALDLAPTVVSQLPLGAEDHRHAWSRATGRWRRVRVRYPWLRPGYGQHPLMAALGAVAVGFAAAVVLRFSVRLYSGDSDPFVSSDGDMHSGILTAALILGTLAAAVAAWSAVKLVYAVGDLVRTETREGIVLRARVRRGWVGLTDRRSRSSDDRVKERFFCALDSGDTTDIAAWRVRPNIFDQVTQGQSYRIEVTPRLGFVRSVQPMASEDPGASRR